MGAHKETRVAIIGAGLGGTILAISLRKKLGLESFTIFEKTDGPGGTWRDNTYPGCACDIPAHWYSYSAEPNPDWSKTYARQPEILAYWQRIHDKHGLGRKTRYNSNFKEARWSRAKQLYEITFERTDAKGETFVVEAEVLVSCIGGFSTPLDEPPSLPGLKDFKGERMHSANWDHSVDLNNKTVGLIGNGASGSQIFPVLVKDYPSSKIINFSRTPSWFWPRGEVTYNSFVRWCFRYVPLVQWIYRMQLAAILDGRYFAWVMPLTMTRHLCEVRSLRLIKSKAPAKYHEFLTPRYPFGCKRAIVDCSYLDALNAQNAELNTDRIDKITEKGILGKSGEEYPLDVLILATGFDVTAKRMGINVIGTHGKTLTQQWDEQGGPQAYFGTTMANFPNFFTIYGPNIATGHASVISTAESQINYICQMIKPILKGKATSFELKADAEENFQKELRWRGSHSTPSTCDTYYKLPNGKIIVTWPGTVTEFWWRTRKPNFEHYLQQGGNEFYLGSVAVQQRIWWLLKNLFYIYAFISLRRYGFKRLGSEVRTLLDKRYQDLRGAVASRLGQ